MQGSPLSYFQNDAINVQQLGAAGDGFTDDTAIINAAMATCFAAGGGTVYFPWGTYVVSGPLSVPPYVRLAGQPRMSLPLFTTPVPPVSRITASAAWLPSSATGIVTFQSQTPGGWNVASQSSGLDSLVIDGSANSSANLNGVFFKGPVYDCHMQDVMIYKAPHDGVQAAAATEAGITPTFPYHLRMDRVTVYTAGFVGFNCVNFTDSTYTDCLAFGCASDGWMFQNAPDTVLVGCRAQWNGGSGFRISTSGGHFLMSGCETDNNTSRGLRIASVVPGSGNGNNGISVTGLTSECDGRNGTDPGIEVNATTVPVSLTGIQQGMDVISGTGYPVTGMKVTSSPLVVITGSYVEGSTSGYVDGGGNTDLIITGVISGAGAPGAQVYTQYA